MRCHRRSVLWFSCFSCRLLCMTYSGRCLVSRSSSACCLSVLLVFRVVLSVFLIFDLWSVCSALLCLLSLCFVRWGYPYVYPVCFAVCCGSLSLSLSLCVCVCVSSVALLCLLFFHCVFVSVARSYISCLSLRFSLICLSLCAR